eukprot:7143337-Prymnesium_polylepis.1
MYGTEAAGFASMAWSPRVGVYQALREINNKTDGVADHLLPTIQLRFAYCDSKCDATSGLMEALHLTRDAFSGQGVKAIIGAGCSGASGSAAQVGEASNVPIVSPSSTSPALSDGLAYPFFSRSLASDAFSAIVMVDVLQTLLQYTSVALSHSTDAYGAG